jgi:hypothetical protein
MVAGLCRQIEAETKPPDAFDEEKDCVAAAKKFAKLEALERVSMESLTELRPHRRQVQKFYDLWHTPTPDDRRPPGDLVSKIIPFFPNIGRESFRSHAQIKDYMTHSTRLFTERLRKWEEAGKVGDFNAGTRLFGEKDFQALDALKDEIDGALAEFESAIKVVAEVEGQWLGSLKAIDEDARVQMAEKITKSGFRKKHEIAQVAMATLKTEQFADVKKGQAPPPPVEAPEPEGAGVSAAAMARVQETIKSQFEDLAETLKNVPLLNETLIHMRADVNAVKGQMAELHSQTRETIQGKLQEITASIAQDLEKHEDKGSDVRKMIQSQSEGLAAHLQNIAGTLRAVPMSDAALDRVEGTVRKLKEEIAGLNSQTREDIQQKLEDIVRAMDHDSMYIAQAERENDERMREYIGDRFQDIAETLKVAPLAKNTIDRVERDVQAIKAQVAAVSQRKETGAALYTIRRRLDSIALAMTRDTGALDDLVRKRIAGIARKLKDVALSRASADRIEEIVRELRADGAASISQIGDIDAKLDQIKQIADLRMSDQTMIELLHDKTARTVAKMSECLAAGQAVSASGQCMPLQDPPPAAPPKPVAAARARTRCEFVYPDGCRCTGDVDEGGDPRRRLCRVHM